MKNTTAALASVARLAIAISLVPTAVLGETEVADLKRQAAHARESAAAHCQAVQVHRGKRCVSTAASRDFHAEAARLEKEIRRLEAAQ